jgi:hypothetical protein
MTTPEQAALLAKHYNVLVAGELGHEWPMFSVGCVCGDIECNDYTVRVEPTAEEQEAIRRDAVSEAVERIVAALGIEKGATDTPDYVPMSREDGYFYEGVFAGNLEGIDRAISLLRSRDWSKGEGE